VCKGVRLDDLRTVNRDKRADCAKFWTGILRLLESHMHKCRSSGPDFCACMLEKLMIAKG